jgi:lipopolysaccharide biosynthesis regulator YciM
MRNFDNAIMNTKDDDEKLPIFLANRAHALIALDRLDEAIVDCVKACKLDPKCVMASVAHSKAYACKQKIGQAIDILK